MRNHLIRSFAILFSVGILSCKSAGPPPKQDLISQALETPGAVVIDVRSQGEWEDGHVQGATHLPLSEVASKISTLVPSKDTQLVVYCAVGGRAAKAEATLKNLGYTTILNAKTPAAVAKAMGKPLVK